MQNSSSQGFTDEDLIITAFVSLSITVAIILAWIWFDARDSSASQVENWTDNRAYVYELSGQNREDADSVVALFTNNQVFDLGNGTSLLLTGKYGERYNLCPSERFQEQPSGSFCSGVLVAPDVIATAGHCIYGMNVGDIRFVFGYHMRDESTPELIISNSDIYHGVEIIAWQLDDNTVSDWALIRLDRTVVNHHIARVRESGTISDGQPVHIIGHPMGLPAKFAGGASVRDNRFRAFFITNLDTYPGNSGSPVFNSTTHVVEGLYVRAEGRFFKQGRCWVSHVCSESDCRSGESTRTTEFVDYLAWLH